MCRCWKIDRADGRTFCFTDHDIDIVIEGLIFLASGGPEPSALQYSTGMNVDNGQFRGALSSELIREDELRAGLFDDAAVQLWLVDWRSPKLDTILFRGFFGEIRQDDGRFEVEIRGLTEGLNLPSGRTILKTCGSALGDARCRVDLTEGRFSTVSTVGERLSGTRMATDLSGDFPNEWFWHGSLEWLSGRNAGTRQSIRSDRRGEGRSRTIELWVQPPFAVESGDRFRISAGCDKRAETCRDKFQNLLNFQGFPHLPGDDWVAAYPKDGDNHDGSSLKNR